MSEEFETDFAEDANTPQPHRPEDMTIQELRRLATSYGIRAQRDWVKEDFILAVNNRRNKNETLVQLVADNSVGPAPGHARIMIHATQTGSNHPIPVNVNNYYCRIPRDVEVDVPIPILEALNNSKTPVRAKDPRGGVDGQGKPKMVWKEVPSYPYQVLGITPGTARHPSGALKIKPSTSPSKQGLREKYREIYGKWPRREEYKKFQAMHMERKATQAIDKEDVEFAKASKD
jgi:hypothetical protein